MQVSVQRITLPAWKLIFSWKLSQLSFVKGASSRKITLPSYYFVKRDNLKLQFLQLLHKGLPITIFQQLHKLLFNHLFFFKLRIKGLGYRLRSISEYCHYFFFNYTNYYYFFNPVHVLVKTYKKRMILISFDWSHIRSVVCNILLLQTFGPYTLEGIRWVKQFVILKRSGKKI